MWDDVGSQVVVAHEPPQMVQFGCSVLHRVPLEMEDLWWCSVFGEIDGNRVCGGQSSTGTPMNKEEETVGLQHNFLKLCCGS